MNKWNLNQSKKEPAIGFLTNKKMYWNWIKNELKLIFWMNQKFHEIELTNLNKHFSINKRNEFTCFNE